MNRFTKHLQTIFPESAWPKANDVVFNLAKQNSLAVCGSLGIALACKKAEKDPGDLDFVTTRIQYAQYFIDELQAFLLNHQTYWKVQVNRHTKFCLPGVEAHFRFNCPFWLPICVFVLKSDELPVWFAPWGIQVQKFDQMVAAAKQASDRDGKHRVGVWQTHQDNHQHECDEWDMPEQSSDMIGESGMIHGAPTSAGDGHYGFER